MDSPKRNDEIFRESVLFANASADCTLPVIAVHVNSIGSKRFALIYEYGNGGENFVATGKNVLEIVSAAIETWIEHRIRFRRDVSPFADSEKLSEFLRVLPRMLDQSASSVANYPVPSLARFWRQPNGYWSVQTKPVDNSFPGTIWIGSALNAVDAFTLAWINMVQQAGILKLEHSETELSEEPDSPDDPDLIDWAAADDGGYFEAE